MTNPNDKFIILYQASSFLGNAQGEDMRDFFSSSNKSIGSYYESTTSRRIGSGLNFEEEALLLERILDVPVTHPEFRKKLNEFYQDIDTKVPYDTGCKLNIGLLKSNTDKVSESNLPIAIMDYVRYRHAIGHPHVAMSKELADGNPLKHFYVFDKTEVAKKSSKLIESKDEAMALYQEVKNDTKKIKQALVLLGINPNKMDQTDWVATLRTQAESHPVKFCTTLGSKNFETNYWLQSLLDYKIINLYGAKYYDAETDKLLANSEEEMIHFFNDDTNSDLIGTFKARLQDKELV